MQHRFRSLRRLFATIGVGFSRVLGGLKPQASGFKAQRMRPSCGMITPRSSLLCLECGHTLTRKAPIP